VRYRFLVDTYASERLKVLGVWTMFRDGDLPVRPHSADRRGRSVLEQMVHQCVSENAWFEKMLGIRVSVPLLPVPETRAGFIARYAEASRERLAGLAQKAEGWWEEEVAFFGVRRTRAWVVVRRVAHTAHHRGQQMAMLRMLGRDLHSNYGPTADTGGLPVNQAAVIYAYPDEEALLAGGDKVPLPPPGSGPVSERP
jgi:uncharacterized damage-inducible protein DinB